MRHGGEEGEEGEEAGMDRHDAPQHTSEQPVHRLLLLLFFLNLVLRFLVGRLRVLRLLVAFLALRRPAPWGW